MGIKTFRIRGVASTALRASGVAVVLLCTGSSGVAGAVGQCTNEAFRTGASAHLPDCRVYELVTPADTDGRLIIGPTSALTYDQFPIELMSPVRDSFLYMTYGTPVPGITDPSGTFDLYEAERTTLGWETVRRVTPSGAQALIPDAGGISADHRYSFMHVRPLPYSSGGSLADEGGAAYLGGPDGSFELVGVGELGTERFAQGRFISESGQHVIFTTGSTTGGNWCATSSCPVMKLEPEAAPTGTPAIYDRAADGPTQVISLLPGDVPLGTGEAAEYQGVSRDGSVVAFKVGGTLYARVDNAVTKQIAGSDPTFAGLSQDGGFLFYVSGGNVYRFDISTEAALQINASGDAAVVNISKDGTHVYFISPSQLDGGAGVSGEPNMYVWSAANPQADYVVTVAQSDLKRTSGTAPEYPALTNWTGWAVSPDRDQTEFGVGPGSNSSRTTPDGQVLVFESRKQITDYENQGHTEIYRYDDSVKSLQCVSCNPGAPAVSDARLQAVKLIKPWIALHNVSADGSRVFFETAEPLVAADANGINDVYQWQESAEGSISIDLISSGKSVEYPPAIPGFGSPPQPNILFGISPDGDDVTFLSLDRLVPSAPGGGSPALYDARVNGGFPEPPSLHACHSTAECQRPVTSGAPVLLAPAVAADEGNFAKRRPRCRRPGRKHQHTQKRRKGKHKRCSRPHQKAIPR